MKGMRKACQHYLFYWFNSKGLPLKLYVSLAGSIENAATNKKNLSISVYLFIFFFSPSPAHYRRFCIDCCQGFTHFIIFMSSHYVSTTSNSSLPPRGICGIEEGKLVFYRTTVDGINRGWRFWLWKVMPVWKCLKINGQKRSIPLVAESLTMRQWPHFSADLWPHKQFPNTFIVSTTTLKSSMKHDANFVTHVLI